MLFIFEELLRSNFRYGRMPGSRGAQRGIVRKKLSVFCGRAVGARLGAASKQEPVVSEELYLKEEDQKHGRAYI